MTATEHIATLAAEVYRLRKQIEGHCARIVAQSELLATRAERRPCEVTHACDRCRDAAVRARAADAASSASPGDGAVRHDLARV